MSDPVKRLRSQIAQLRHAYMQLAGQTVKRQKEFADGLISPAIQEFEEAADEIERLNETIYRIWNTSRSAILDDMREWLDTFDPPPRSYEGSNFLTHLEAYEKDKLK